MAREEEFEYESSSAPATPRNSGNGEKKQKRTGIRKLISFTTKKSPSDLDKSERGISKDDGGGSPSRSRRFNIFNRPKSQKGEDNAHPTKKDEPKPLKPENNEKIQNLSEINKGLRENDRPRNEVLKEETKPSKHNLPVETIGEVLNLSENAKEDHPHKPTQALIDDKGKSKEHQEPKLANDVQEKEVVKHDQQNHHKQNEDHKGDAKDEKPVATSEAVEEQSKNLGSPPPILQEEAVGCESLAKGLQKVCLPWTINKEDH